MELYITKYEDKHYYYTMNEYGHIYDFYPEEMIRRANDGNLYIGVVKDISKPINAAFVNIGEENAGMLAEVDMSVPVRSGQQILVQVLRGSYGKKGAKLTMKISLAGNTCILLTDTNKIQFSQRLSTQVKTELKKFLAKQVFEYGFIIRSGVSDGQALLKEMRRLEAKVKTLIDQSRFLKGPCLVWEKSPLDMMIGHKDVEAIYTNDRQFFEQAVAYSQINHLPYPIHYRQENYYLKHDLKQAMNEAMHKKIWLSGGGYLLLEKTEAMYVIDVNTGKTKGAANFEKTAYKTNLEAARQIARQMRLRNLSGIVLVDFIDMKQDGHKQDLIEKMKAYTAKDPIAVTIHGLTKLGLMEITRKKQYWPLDQYLMSEERTAETDYWK